MFLFILLLLVFLMNGCAIAVPVVVSVAGTGVVYTYSQSASRTYTEDFDTIKKASLAAMKKMNIVVDRVLYYEREIEIHARTDLMEVILEIEPVTSKSTKVTAKVSKDLVRKDKATATEILDQLGEVLKKKKN